jgi:two-component system cell cycle response regulator DivK
MGKSILIVEDDPKNMRLFRDLLQVKGYETFEATDGRQGVDSARLRRPGLILMDIMLPVLNGIEAIRILKADVEMRMIPIIALTSFALPNEKQRIFEAGGDGYMLKPVNIRALITKIKKYLRE